MFSSRLKGALEKNWPDRNALLAVCLTELRSELTLPTSACGPYCVARQIREDLERRLGAAVTEAQTFDNLLERLRAINF